MNHNSNIRKVTVLFAILTVLILADTLGYMLIEDARFFDALYMTFISITTVGYTEPFPMTTRGRLFTIWVIVSGLGAFFYIMGNIAEHMLEGNIRRILGRRKMKILLKMKDHVIVAGYGRMGERVCRELHARKIKFVAIENNADRFALAEEQEFHVMLGDATDEATLRSAGLANARTFISLLASDADNIFTVMAARELNPSITIIARALEAANENRLYKVGAHRVISPYDLGSRRIVNSVLRPNVVDFIDFMTYAPKMALSIEEVTVEKGSPFAGRMIKDSGLREKYNIIVVAIRRGGEMVFNPGSDQEILVGDILILVGEKTKLTAMD